MNLIATILALTVAPVYGGNKVLCKVGAGAGSSILGAACTLMTLGLGAAPCAAGRIGISTLANRGCDFVKRDIVIDPESFQKSRHAYCLDFGEEYGFECIKPRHIKKLGDFMINQSCTIPDNADAKKCLGTKFYASCDGNEWKLHMCKIGFECEQEGHKNATCLRI